MWNRGEMRMRRTRHADEKNGEKCGKNDDLACAHHEISIKKIKIRSCAADTQAREGARIPPSHLPHFPLARRLLRIGIHTNIIECWCA
jgi:hypothetical protein